MKYYNYEGKNKEEAISKALNELNTNRENLYIEITEEVKGIVKKKIVIKVVKIDEIINYIKELLTQITALMNIEVNFEIRKREGQIEIKMFSDNNSILIGKNGKTIQSMQILVKQIIYNIVEMKIPVILDVENYKQNRQKSLEILARKTAQEVYQTKLEVTLDSMNSYERRIIHETLSKDKYIYTESIGEEPNRSVVIKLKAKE